MPGQLLAQAISQPAQPAHLVVELGRTGRLPVDEIAVHQAQFAGWSLECRRNDP
jgi:hypothetical protein